MGMLEVTSNSTSFTTDLSTPFVVKISFTRACEAFRGLGHILGATRYPLLRDQKNLEQRWILDEETMLTKLPIQQTANFTTLGTMIDCSRNGVLLVDSVKFLCRKLALMGYNML